MAAWPVHHRKFVRYFRYDSCLQGQPQDTFLRLLICNTTLSLKNYQFRNGLRRMHHLRLDQSIDAIIYVTVVFVMFAAIILLLVSTNCRRFQTETTLRKPKGQQMVVHFQENRTVVSTEAVPQEIV
ncbi:uncharacterized protein LOC135398308 [Ornithodoros turicata]|uniref:uncharacterized protein LOC135398308 n=1 Tax=Ornithodoros turicata TaxID=34597 RepID=UPI003138E869